MAEPESKDEKKKKLNARAVWAEARQLIHESRRRLAIGLALLLVSRLSGMVLPYSSKFVFDDVIGKGRRELLVPIALACAAAMLVSAVTGFGLSQILGVATKNRH